MPDASDTLNARSTDRGLIPSCLNFHTYLRLILN